MVQRAFPSMLGLQEEERFIVVDHSVGISFVGAFCWEDQEMVVSVISVSDSIQPTKKIRIKLISLTFIKER